MTNPSGKSAWRGGVLRLAGALAVLLVPFAAAVLATRLRSSAPVVPLAWAAAVYLFAYPAYRFVRRGDKRDHTVGNLAWLMSLLIGALAISPTRFPWD